ncbi:TMEM175 family protein [Streptomyces brasiliensis]|uniref:DUF1211 domain-containing membrane protein n=1 Tax=Streptomyces brasiliensis TaxID=1954 RepID=A0A917KZT4_9ACTN|nr:TMEM175 family protein [Streptomyces brasiliensis]GGJ34642.1 DUF1211 domain-containing membrane protein [Streptomyces brasiliensis]
MSRPDDEPEQGSRLSETTRVEAFSDGVFAIVITLLVLDLQNPAHTPGGLLSALAAQWPSYLAFFMSFVYVGVIWLNHHALFQRIGHVDRGLHWVNLGILLGAVVMPFPTAILAEALAQDATGRDAQVAVALYAIAAALMSATWWAAFRYLRSRPHLWEPDVEPSYMQAQRFRPLTGMALYTISGLAGWLVSPWAGMTCIMIMIVYHAVTSEGLPARGVKRRPRRSRPA